MKLFIIFHVYVVEKDKQETLLGTEERILEAKPLLRALKEDGSTEVIFNRLRNEISGKYRERYHVALPDEIKVLTAQVIPFK